MNPHWDKIFSYFNIMSQYFIPFTKFIYWIYSAAPDRTVCPLVGRSVDWSVHPSVHQKPESIKINTIKSWGCIFSLFFRCVSSSLCTTLCTLCTLNKIQYLPSTVDSTVQFLSILLSNFNSVTIRLRFSIQPS